MIWIVAALVYAGITISCGRLLMSRRKDVEYMQPQKGRRMPLETKEQMQAMLATHQSNLQELNEKLLPGYRDELYERLLHLSLVVRDTANVLKRNDVYEDGDFGIAMGFVEMASVRLAGCETQRSFLESAIEDEVRTLADSEVWK